MCEKLLSEGCKADYAYLILSGGENRRMGGKNKLFLEVAGRRQLERLLSCIRETEKDMGTQDKKSIPALQRTVYLSVKQEEKSQEYADCALFCIPDLVSKRGPLAGIVSSLCYLKEEKRRSEGENVPDALLVLSSDLFGLEKEALLPLLKTYQKSGRPVFYRSGDGLPAPFPGIYTTDMETAFSAALSGEGYRLRNLIQEWILRQGAGALLDAPESFWKIRNLNTPEAWKNAGAYEQNERKNQEVK
ncbi:MAG: NTP transferase domain-containing protein [Eubacteriales bacterium]|nr:NTP transferase domain-containing protein [Eubacteriales bacterium]